MKTATAEMTAHIAAGTSTLAWCWSITRTDEQSYYYTAHDRRLPIDGHTYVPSQGFSTSAVESVVGLGVNKSEVQALLRSEGLLAHEVRAGLFDYAEVRVFLVNWSDLSQGRIRIRRGRLGEVTLTPEGVFKAELRSLTQAYSTRIIEVTSAECRTDLFSPRCKLNADDFEASGTVDAVGSRRVFSFSGDTEESGYYSGGSLKWTSGDNAGRVQEIYDHYSGEMTLFLPPGYAIQPGDTFDMWPGCNKMRATCRDKFSNVFNFQGEPDLPGNDKFLDYPDAPAGG